MRFSHSVCALAFAASLASALPWGSAQSSLVAPQCLHNDDCADAESGTGVCNAGICEIAPWAERALEKRTLCLPIEGGSSRLPAPSLPSVPKIVNGKLIFPPPAPALPCTYTCSKSDQTAVSMTSPPRYKCMSLKSDPMNCGMPGMVCPGKASAYASKSKWQPICTNGKCDVKQL